MNGKKFAWQGVALLPFVDEQRLFKALEPLYDQLSPEELKRNERGDDRLYVSNKNNGYSLLSNLYKQNVQLDSECSITIDGMKGTILVSEINVPECGSLESPVTDLETITNNMVVCVRFRDPKYNKGFIFPARKLKGVRYPQRVLKPEDLDHGANRNWRAQIGMVPATQRFENCSSFC